MAFRKHGGRINYGQKELRAMKYNYNVKQSQFYHTVSEKCYGNIRENSRMHKNTQALKVSRFMSSCPQKEKVLLKN